MLKISPVVMAAGRCDGHRRKSLQRALGRARERRAHEERAARSAPHGPGTVSTACRSLRHCGRPRIARAGAATLERLRGGIWVATGRLKKNTWGLITL